MGKYTITCRSCLGGCHTDLCKFFEKDGPYKTYDDWYDKEAENDREYEYWGECKCGNPMCDNCMSNTATCEECDQQARDEVDNQLDNILKKIVNDDKLVKREQKYIKKIIKRLGALEI